MLVGLLMDCKTHTEGYSQEKIKDKLVQPKTLQLKGKPEGPCSKHNPEGLKHLKWVKLLGSVILTQIIKVLFHTVTVKDNSDFRIPTSVFGHALISVMVSLTENIKKNVQDSGKLFVTLSEILQQLLSYIRQLNSGFKHKGESAKI